MRKATKVAAGLLTSVLTAGLIAPAFATAASASEAHPEPDQLAVVLVGDGETYGNVAGPTSIRLIDSNGAPVGAVDIPVAGSDGQHPFTLGVDRDQAGALQQSVDHRYVVVGGYDAPLGASTNGSDAPETLRVVARVDAAGAVDTSTSLGAAYNTRHIRGVATVDGSQYWTGGHGNDSEGDVRAGVLTLPHGGDSPQAVTTGGGTLNNTRVPVIHDGQLFVSSDRSGHHGVNVVGEGLPNEVVGMALIAEAPEGLEVPHDFAFIGDHLYVTYTDGDSAIVRYVWTDQGWEAQTHYAGEFWGLTGRVAGDEVVLYATRGSDASNELVKIIDQPNGDFAEAAEEVIAVAPANQAFRGVAFAPGFVPGTDAVDFVQQPAVAWDVRVAGGVGNALSGVMGADSNPVATGRITDPALETFDADAYEVTVTSEDETVVKDGDIGFTMDAEGFFIVAPTPAGEGRTTINVTVTAEDNREVTSRLSYWVSAALPGEGTLAHVGVADASAAIDAGEAHFFVADDDSNAIRLFGPTFGEPVAEFDFSTEMAHPTDRSFDLEGAARVGDTIYWVGSLGNSRSGNYWPHRDIVFATQVDGSGADATLTFLGEATGFRDALVEWDHADGHGGGAGALQFERATTPGTSAEGPNSLNLEGAAIAPDGTTLWLGFRSPLVPVAADVDNDEAGTLALIIAVENIADVISGEADIVIGGHLTLDLEGRAIRDLRETDDGNYLIAAGSADDTGNFAIFGWTGDLNDAPVKSVTPLALEGWAGSYESIPSAASLDDGTVVRVLQDVGTVDIYGTGSEAQDLTREFMKFPSHDYVLDFDGAFAPAVPALTTSAASVSAGGTVDVAVTGFAAGEDITFTLHSTPVIIGSGVAEADGSLAMTLEIPANIVAGSHTLVAAAASGSASTDLLVTAATVDPAPTDPAPTTPGAGAGSGGLATTGAEGLELLGGAAILLLLAGSGIMAMTRKRKRETTQ